MEVRTHGRTESAAVVVGALRGDGAPV
jgi:hypothetical protein